MAHHDLYAQHAHGTVRIVDAPQGDTGGAHGHRDVVAFQPRHRVTELVDRPGVAEPVVVTDVVVAGAARLARRAYRVAIRVVELLLEDLLEIALADELGLLHDHRVGAAPGG